MLFRLLLLFSSYPSGLLAHAENIKIGLPSVTITAMPFFVAKEHGFFQQEGLNAEMVVMPASLNIKVLLAGDIQYAATMGSAVAAAIRGINVRTSCCSSTGRCRIWSARLTSARSPS